MKLPALALCLSLIAAAEPASLRVESSGSDGGVELTRTELLRRPEHVRLSVSGSPTFKPGSRVDAVPVWALLSGVSISADGQVEAVCADGFTASLPAELALNRDPSKAIAFIAIEDPKHPWAPVTISGQEQDAGPFYWVWQHPERSGVTREQWPFQIVALRAKGSVLDELPALQPDPHEAADSPVRRGLKTFIASCLPCHRLNGAGKSDIGPDLNVPRNPTQYFAPEVLRAFIRDPQSLHRWPSARMPQFGTDAISEVQLDELIAYLRHMAGRGSR